MISYSMNYWANVNTLFLTGDSCEVQILITENCGLSFSYCTVQKREDDSVRFEKN